MEATINKIPVLNGSNYWNWKFKLELLLRKQNLWKKVILNKRPSPNVDSAGTIKNQKEIDEWDQCDDEARGTIGLSVEDDQLPLIRLKVTSKECWDALKDYYEKNTLTNKVFLMRTICSLKLEPGGDARAHIHKMQNLFSRLRDMGEEVLSDTWSAAMLLSSLPRNYDTLITTLEARKEDEITYALVQQKIIDEYDRYISKEITTKDSVLKLDGKIHYCFFCKKPDHYKKDCPKYKIWLAKKVKTKKTTNDRVNAINEESDSSFNLGKDFLFAIGQEKNNKWILDSGATRHVVNDKKFFTEIDEHYNTAIKLADGESAQVQGIGNGFIEFCNNKNTVHRTELSQVLFVPKLVGNVLSVKQLTKCGFEINFSGCFGEIKCNGKQIGVADSIVDSDLYILRQPESVCLLQHNDKCIHT